MKLAERHARPLLALATVVVLIQASAEAQSPVLNPANGHYYQLVSASAGSWSTANSVAQSMSYLGRPGHLATVTDSAEDQWIIANILPTSGYFWLGGIQDNSSPTYSEPAGGWTWVTGEPWGYESWDPVQPDNCCGGEDFLEYRDYHLWNDHQDSGSGSSSGFVVEYELPPVVAFCFGDGSAGACPCANSGLIGHGCDNSAATGGALLSATGIASLSADTLQFTSSAELPHSLSIVLQGSSSLGSLNFGDGLRCTGGLLKRLYVRNAVNGALTVPVAGDPPVSVRSAALNDPITAGSTRNYQVYYRDPDTNFCPSPSGATYNISSALSVVWSN